MYIKSEAWNVTVPGRNRCKKDVSPIGAYLKDPIGYIGLISVTILLILYRNMQT